MCRVSPKMSWTLIISGYPKYLLSCSFSLFYNKWIPGMINCWKYTWTITSPNQPCSADLLAGTHLAPSRPSLRGSSSCHPTAGSFSSCKF